MVMTLSRQKLPTLLRTLMSDKEAEQQSAYVGVLEYGTLDEKELTLAQLPDFPVAIYRGDGQLVYRGKASRAGLERLARRMWPHERGVAICESHMAGYGLRHDPYYVTGTISDEEMRRCADWVLVGERAFRIGEPYPPIVSRSAIDLLLD